MNDYLSAPLHTRPLPDAERLGEQPVTAPPRGTTENPLVVDIGAALAMLQASPELAATMSEIIGGPALIEAQQEIADLNEALNGLIAANSGLAKAATAVYRAAVWRTPTLSSEAQAKLWEGLRDALGLEPGGSNKPYQHLTGGARQ